MRHSKKWLSVLILVAISVMGVVCPISSSYAKDDVVPFVVATANGPGKLDPLDAYDSESMDTIMQVVEGLYIYNYSSAEMEVIPNLAASLGTWSLDMLNLTIGLKQGVRFHDGSSFNARAVKWNFDRLQYWTFGLDIDHDGDLDNHPLGTASKSLFEQKNIPILNRTEILDDFTIRFVLNTPSVIWEKLLAFVPCSIVLPDTNYLYGYYFFNRIDLNDELIGTGPFKLTEYIFDEQLVFDYNPDYHMTWGENHIERMIYRIIPDPVTESLAIIDHEIHWGEVLPSYKEYWCCDPALIDLARKESVVYFMQMNLYTMKWEYRYASSFVWNHTYFLEEVLGGRHYELHVPVPDGMQYHHEGFDGEPYHDYRIAQEILLNSSDAEIQGNITLNGLSASSTREDWQAVAESTTPIAVFNFTRYESNLLHTVGTLMQEYLKDIGIKLVILDVIPWDDWVEDYLEDSDGHKNLAYSFGGWGPDYNDPINMIEPLYGTGALSNYFMLANDTWNDKLIATYSEVGDTRRDLFYEIQEEFCTVQVPSFYLLQLGGSITFNRDFLDEDSIGDLLNIFGHLYWFHCKFTPPIANPSPILTILLIIGLIGIGIIFTITIIKVGKRSKLKRESLRKLKEALYCPECGAKHDKPFEICEYCGKIKEEKAVRKYMDEFDPFIPDSEIKFCPQCGSFVKNQKCTKCGKTIVKS
ncbi:MAG: hypothetical protein EU530_06955 [Promethearchaeota archaeon]|nr:MAG: hypothetical protein EU530_06955 [Candidatus Lokiarchaeota archaeon]